MDRAGVLIVSASTGTGHGRAAEALQQAFADEREVQPVEHVDLLELAPRWVRLAYGDGYELMAAHAPWLWRQVYHRTDAPDADYARWGALAQRTLFRAFRDLLLSRRWAACVCTHFLPGQLAAGGVGAPPFALVVTDLTLHRYWAQPRVRRYFAGTEAVAREIGTRVPGAAVQATGIPVAARFAAAPSQQAARYALGLDLAGPVVLVMGGGLGLGVAETAEAAAAADVHGLRVLAACGRNEFAARRLRQLDRADGWLRVFGYTDRIDQLIAAADVVVTKPGGLTTSEALAVGRPLLLTRPIPGQEEGNTRVLVSAGAAVEAGELPAVRAALERLFSDRAALGSLADAARRMGRPHAARTIARAVRRELVVDAAA